MAEDLDIVTLGALIGQPARAAMLLTLMDGRGRTATELADIAETTRSTASFHLAQLVEGKVIRVERQGRHRYFRLARPEVAELLESLLVVSKAPRAATCQLGPRSTHLRQARMCYDHIAGALGIGLIDGLIRSGALLEGSDSFHLTADGERFFDDFGIDVTAARRKRRHFARLCLDWSERRPHLAGALGAALADRLFTLHWIDRDPDGRTLFITTIGQKGFAGVFGVDLPDLVSN